MSRTKISIIMPAYNCENYIRHAIDSILNQSFNNFELLISDDASLDSTKTIIDKYSDHRIRLFHNTQNLGYLKTCNKLATYATGDYITFQDADDWSEPRRLELLINEFKKKPELSCVGAFVNVVDEDGVFLKSLEYETEHEQIIESLLKKRLDCFNSAMLFKKEVYEKIGLYNLYFDRIGSEDYYWYGVVVSNFKVGNIKHYLYNYRVNPASFSREKHPVPKKQMSGELANIFFMYYFINGKEIFSHKYYLKVVELFVIGKSYCWRNQVGKGVWMILKSIFLNPCGYTERYRLLKIYMPKLIKW